MTSSWEGCKNTKFKQNVFSKRKINNIFRFDQAWEGGNWDGIDDISTGFTQEIVFFRNIFSNFIDKEQICCHKQ